MSTLSLAKYSLPLDKPDNANRETAILACYKAF